MKDSLYSIVPLHARPELAKDCCALINSEWPRSETARLRTLNASCEEFPTCLILLKEKDVIGHCKISLIPSLENSCFVQSVVIDNKCRTQGLGSMLMQGTEKYVKVKGIKKVYLMTQGQEGFYLKNGYKIIEPVNIYGSPTFLSPVSNITNTENGKKEYLGPPPPPMPNQIRNTGLPIISSKTYMLKAL
ncbi:N-acetyltransferase 6 isoform X2 [Orussus abietinus]|nr:N-acetyltransferase 6 isoform X2 [Orussus abietinus]